MEWRMSWYHALLKAPKRPSASQALLWGYFCIAGGGHRHPSHPCHKNEKKAGLTKQHEECRGTTRNIMMSWSVLETRCMYYNIMGYRGIPCNRVEYQSVGKVTAYTGISWSVEQFSGSTWNAMISWAALEAHWLYWNIIECWEALWDTMENDDVVVCLGSSLNIQEYHGMVYVVISCIAELTLSLSNTTLGMSLYRRKGALAPGPPLPQELEKGWPR